MLQFTNFMSKNMKNVFQIRDDRDMEIQIENPSISMGIFLSPPGVSL
jgi:hypothetical protein